jgi:Sulfotransferase family
MSVSTMVDPEDLTERARCATGLSDFGPDGWQIGLEHFVASARVDIGTNPSAVATVEAMAVGRLANRLKIERWYADHRGDPIDPVQGPVFIVGLPRTATTALHYLLAIDPQFRYQRRWEVADPVPPPDLATEAEDPRRLSATASLSVQHIATSDGPLEDGALLALDFHNQELGLPLPSYTRWWRCADMTSTYAYHDRVLSLLHSRRPPSLWLLKAPAYCFHLPQIASQYPQARFLMTHRDPVVAFASTCSVVQEARRLLVPSYQTDPVELGGFLLEHLVEATRRALSAREILGDHRFCDVHQADVEARPMETVERIYRFLGLPLSDDVRSAMEDWTVENRRGARGEHRYTAEQYGQTAETLREAFHEYIGRLGDLNSAPR